MVSDCFPPAFNKSQNLEQFLEGVLHVFPAHVVELAGHLVQSNPSITSLIADTFHTSAAAIANKYNLVCMYIFNNFLRTMFSPIFTTKFILGFEFLLFFCF